MIRQFFDGKIEITKNEINPVVIAHYLYFWTINATRIL